MIAAPVVPRERRGRAGRARRPRTPTQAPRKEITSPMVGTFYRAASPESPPFVDVGKEVNEDTVVCIIEAMKVMNEIKAEANGVDRRGRGRERQAGAIRPGLVQSSVGDELAHARCGGSALAQAGSTR